MLNFESDYICGAHPAVLVALTETNLEPASGYGEDRWCESARAKIRAACGCPDARVEFLVGGTQTNAVVISSMLRDWEGVVAAVTGHVSVHEAGAIEYTGHKVIELPQRDGKLSAEDLARCLRDFHGDANREHMVWPGMAYISHPTEYGTLYSRAELAALSAVCREHGIPLFMDGARLGYGLMSRETDVTLEDIAALCDVFYIGGTKVGALCGEAVVFPDPARCPAHFLNAVKKRGALLAKGRLLGVQFDALFTDGLYFDIGRHAIDMAERLKRIFADKGYPMFIHSPTNQQFVILDDDAMARLSGKVAFSFWERLADGRTVVRFATSWSTTEEELDALEEML